MSASPYIFFLGATGYVGSQLLILLARDFPSIPITALVRNPTPARLAELKALHPGITVIEGTLDDDETIQRHAADAPIIINTASSDHWPSVKSTLAGLEKNSAAHPGKPPLYIHVSGLGIISDNARGEHIDRESAKVWSDVGLDLEHCPPQNTHLESDKPIMAAGTRKENPVRTIIIFPCWIYGAVDRGVQKSTLPLRIFVNLALAAGHAGTVGPGKSRMNNIHVLDVATALLAIFKAALEGKADEGAEGLYFATSLQPIVSSHEWNAKLGDILHRRGVLKEGGARPFSDEILEPLGEKGWSLLGGNQFSRPDRLARLGWEPKETLKLSIMDALEDEVDIVLKESVHGRITFS